MTLFSCYNSRSCSSWFRNVYPQTLLPTIPSVTRFCYLEEKYNATFASCFGKYKNVPDFVCMPLLLYIYKGCLPYQIFNLSLSLILDKMIFYSQFEMNFGIKSDKLIIRNEIKNIRYWARVFVYFSIKFYLIRKSIKANSHPITLSISVTHF